MILLVIPLLLAFAASPMAQADSARPEDQCAQFYQSGEYEKAADCYNVILYSGRLPDTSRLIPIYERLGVCQTMLDKKGPARGAFIKLLDLRSDHELDPNIYLPEVISLFQIAKFEQKTSLKVLIMDTLPAYPVSLNFLPFGVPQFMNLHWRKGAAAGGLQALLLGLSIFAYSQKASYYSPEFGYREEDVPAARRYDYTQRAAFFGLAGAYVYSLVDGFLNKRITLKE